MKFICNSMVFYPMSNHNTYWVPCYFCEFAKLKWYHHVILFYFYQIKWNLPFLPNKMKWWVPNKPLEHLHKVSMQNWTKFRAFTYPLNVLPLSSLVWIWSRFPWNLLQMIFHIWDIVYLLRSMCIFFKSSSPPSLGWCDHADCCGLAWPPPSGHPRLLIAIDGAVMNGAKELVDV
jgi:hypothetical protein